MSRTRAQLIDFYFDEINEKGVSFSDMSKKLENEVSDPEERRIIIQQVDNQLHQANLLSGKRSMARNYLYVGWFMIAFGMAITFLTCFNVIDLGNQFIIAYVPMGIGGVAVLKGRRTLMAPSYFKRKY
jgi:hypothetical protein